MGINLLIIHNLLVFHTDYYLNNQIKFDKPNFKYAVFIDNYFPFHSDPKRVGKQARENPDIYYPELCKFFNTVTHKTGYEIIIAAHPRSNYDTLPDYFGGRRLIKNKTNDLIQNCEFVIMHVSASITLPILYSKPIIFITTQRLNKTKFKNVIPTYAKLIGKKPINISKKVYTLDFNKELIVNDNKYNIYINDYIKKSGTQELPYWEIVSNQLIELSY